VLSHSRILYITYDGLLEPLGRSQVIPLVQGLGRRDLAVEVLSFEKPQDLKELDAVAQTRRALEEAGVAWHPLSYHAWPSLPATGYDIWRGTRAIRRFIRVTRGDVILHARSYVAASMGLRGRERLQPRRLGWGPRPKLIFDMRGFWVDERIEAGLWKPESTVVRLVRRTEGKLLREADWLVHLTWAGMKNVKRLSPKLELPPSSVIPTMVDMDRFRPAEDRSALRHKLGLGDGPVIIHTGTLSGWYLGSETFRLGKSLVEKTGGSLVVLTREEGLAKELARKEKVSVHIRSVPHEDVPQWLAGADVGLSLVRPGFSKTASAPTKIGEYLAAGLVVVGSRGVGDLEEHFAGSQVALAVDPYQDPEVLVPQVLAALARPGRVAEARALAARYYDLGRAIDGYRAIYGKLGVAQ